MKRITYIIIAVLAVGFSSAAVIAGMNLHTRAISKKQINSMTQAIVTENERLKSRQDILTSEVNSKTDSTDEKKELNNSIAKLKEDIQKTDNGIKEKTGTIDRLERETEDAEKAVAKLKSGIDLKKGHTEVISDTVVLEGNVLKAGRYIARGNGSFSVSSVMSGARISEDLLLIDSYTFDLEEGERVSVHGTVSFTELK